MITHRSLDELWEAIFDLTEAHGAQAIFDLTEAHGAPPMSKHKDGWALRLDEHWWMAINGQSEPVKVVIPPPNGTNQNEVTIPPFHVYVEFKGWPFAFIRPESAEIGCGELANADTLYDAIVQATERRRLECASPSRP